MELSRDGIASLRVFDITPLTRAPGPCSVTASSITSMMARITTSSCQVFIENTLFAHFFKFFFSILSKFYVIKLEIPGRVKIEDMFDINIKTHKENI